MDSLLDYASRSAVILEDNPQMRAIIRSILGQLGLRRIAEFTEPTDMIGHLHSAHIDVAIVDLVLGGAVDGMDCANAIRHAQDIVNPTMPIIMVTGYPSAAVIDQAINHGIDELVVKPLRARDLIARVRSVIEHPRTYIGTPSGYFGPDRRRRADPFYHGPERRLLDEATVVSSGWEARAAIAGLVPDAAIEQRVVNQSITYLD